MPDPSVDPLEHVSRFLINGDIRSSDNTVRHRAFLPSASKLEISVFRISDLLENAIWALAIEKVEPTRGKVIGRGDLTVSTIMGEGLRVRPDQNTTSRHADIVDWPTDRDARASIAQVLAAKASPPKTRDFYPE